MNRGFADILAENDAARLANQVHDTIKKYHDTAQRALEKAAMTKEEVKSEVINEYAQENERIKAELRYAVAFLYSDAELEAYNEFVKEHEPCRLDLKVNGGKMPYVVQTGTGIGVCTKVCCQICGASKDITDTSIW